MAATIFKEIVWFFWIPTASSYGKIEYVARVAGMGLLATMFYDPSLLYRNGLNTLVVPLPRAFQFLNFVHPSILTSNYYLKMKCRIKWQKVLQQSYKKIN